MAGDDLNADALAVWLAQGTTSDTQPVLRFALKVFLHPIGIEADALEAEPFSGLEGNSSEWWLWNPRWNARSFDRSRPEAADFGYALEGPPSIQVAVSSRGWLQFSPAGPEDLAAAAFFRSSENGWLARRHSLRASRELEVFLCAAAALLLVDESLASVYAAGDVAAYCAAVQRAIAQSA